MLVTKLGRGLKNFFIQHNLVSCKGKMHKTKNWRSFAKKQLKSYLGGITLRVDHRSDVEGGRLTKLGLALLWSVSNCFILGSASLFLGSWLNASMPPR